MTILIVILQCNGHKDIFYIINTRILFNPYIMEYLIDFNDCEIITYKNDSIIVINRTLGTWCVLNQIDFLIVKNLFQYNHKYISKDYFISNINIIRNLFYSCIININKQQYLIESDSNSNEIDCPFSLIIKTTNKCNLNCSYCYTHSAKISIREITSDNIITLLNRLRKQIGSDRIIHMTFHGGEPLLCFSLIKDIIEVIEKKFINIFISIQTNGILISKEIIDYCTRKSIRIGVSLDGISFHDNIGRFGKEGKFLYNRVLNNIELLIKSNIDFGILTVINKMNYDSIYDFVKFFHAMGVKKFVLNPMLKLDGADNEINTDVLLENYLNLINYIDGVNNNICHPDDYISERGITTIIHSLFLNKSQQCYSLPCGAAMNLLACDSNGDIYPCDVFFNNNDFIISNCQTYDYNKRTDIVNLFSSMSLNNIQDCSSCIFKKFCTFCCPADSYFVHSDFNHCHSMCSFSKKIIPELMYLIAKDKIKIKNFV